MAATAAKARTVAIVGSLDTKGRELAYLKERLEACGAATHVIDVGVLGEPAFEAETPREETARAAGSTLAELRAKNDRGQAMEAMCRGAAEVARRLHAAGAIHGIIAAGGSANTTVGAAAMRVLPVGFPKLLVSTLAAGDVSAYVGTSDVTLMYSVVDVAGINRLSARILANAAHAIAGMALHEPPPRLDEKPLVCASMFGVTTPCVTRAREILEAAGFEVLVFHATGTGGRTMEGLIRDGFVQGVLDITTTELADELVGGILSAGPERLTAAARRGVPQIVSIGAIDMVNFGPRSTVPGEFASRHFYQHNPTVTLMRTTPEENEELGRRIAERLNLAVGPVEVLLPARGVSLYAKAGGPFHDPEADRRCRDAIQKRLRRDIPCREIDTDINDPAFAKACAEALLAMLQRSKRP